MENSKALNYLLNLQEEKKQLKIAKSTPVIEYSPNEYGFYSMQQMYILNSMVGKVEIEKHNDGTASFSYENKAGKTKIHKFNLEAFNTSSDAYNTLRGLGIKNCIELLEYGDIIKLLRKIGDEYFITTITGDGIADEHYDGKKQLLELMTI